MPFYRLLIPRFSSGIFSNIFLRVPISELLERKLCRIDPSTHLHAKHIYSQVRTLNVPQINKHIIQLHSILDESGVWVVSPKVFQLKHSDRPGPSNRDALAWDDRSDFSSSLQSFSKHFWQLKNNVDFNLIVFEQTTDRFLLWMMVFCNVSNLELNCSIFGSFWSDFRVEIKN